MCIMFLTSVVVFVVPVGRGYTITIKILVCIEKILTPCESLKHTLLSFENSRCYLQLGMHHSSFDLKIYTMAQYYVQYELQVLICIQININTSLRCKKSYEWDNLKPQLKEEFDDTKGVIRIRISKKNRQHNGQKKKYKRTNNENKIYI